MVPSWLLSQLGHACVDQLPSLSYRSIFCSNYRKCFPEMCVLEEHLIYFLGLDRKQRHSVSRNPLCARGYQKIHLQAAARSCPGTARQWMAPAELLLPSALLSPPGIATAVISLSPLFFFYCPSTFHTALDTRNICQACPPFFQERAPFGKGPFFKERQICSTWSIH